MKHRLADWFAPEQIRSEGVFEALGRADSALPGTLAYCESVFYIDVANRNRCVSSVLTTAELAARVAAGKGLAVADAPRTAFFDLHERLPGEDEAEPPIHPAAVVSARAIIGKYPRIGAHAVIGAGVTLGDGCFVDAGAVLGAEGILYDPAGGRNRRIRHRGEVVIGAGVTVLANAVVVRGIHPGTPTMVGDHAVIGVGSNVGHEAQLEAGCVISGNCVIARGARIGAGAWIGTSAVIREYVRVGARASVKAGAVVLADVAEGEEVSGNFAFAHRRHMLQHLKNLK